MRIFERYLTARIDRALDDGKPLTGLTRRFVMHNKRLRRYYESMLALELELRFSDDVPPADSSPIPAKQMVPFPRQRRYASAIGLAAAVGFLVVAAVLFRWRPETSSTVDYHLAKRPPINDEAQETLTALVSWTETQDALLTESLVAFSERPLELMSILWEPVSSVITKRFPLED